MTSGVGTAPRLYNFGTLEADNGGGATTIGWEYEPSGRLLFTNGHLVFQTVISQPRASEHYGHTSPATPGRVGCAQTSRPVDCATGNQFEPQTDLRVGGRGLGLVLTRTYNSQAAVTTSSTGRFGYGWASSYSDHLNIDSGAGKVTVVHSNGSTAPFYATGSGTFTAPGRIQSTLSQSSGGTYTYTLPDRTSMTFNSSGRLITQADKNANTTTMGYDGGGNLTTITDPAGRQITLTYNLDGTVATATDPAGHIVSYDYEDGELVGVTDVRGETQSFEYDADHQLTSQTDQRGKTTITTYTTDHKVESQTDPDDQTTTFTYDEDVEGGDNTETTVTLPGGSVKRMVFVDYQPTKIVMASGTPDASSTDLQYDPDGNLVSVTDGNDHETTYTYDDAGNRLTRTDPLENTTTWTYNSHRDVTSVTDPLGHATALTYDANGNLTHVTRELEETNEDAETTMVYNSYGELTSLTDALDHETTFEYDADGNLVKTTTPEGNESTATYDDVSQIESATTPRGNADGATAADYTTTYERDAAGLPTTITDPLDNDTVYVYDEAGNVTSVTDRDGRETQFVYDDVGRQTTVIRPDETEIAMTYTPDGQIATRTDGRNKTTTYEYDDFLRPVSVTDPLDRETTFGYDDAGNRTSVLDANGHETTYAYDDANRLTGVDYETNSPQDVTYAYDDAGRRTSMTDGTGTTTFSYDTLNRLASHETGAGQVVGYHYDLADRLTSIDYPDALVPGPPSGTPDTVDGGTVTRTYDDDDRLIAVEDWLDNETTFAYNADDALTEIERPDGTTATHTVDRLNRLTGIDDAGSDYDLDIAYTRTDDGLLASADETGDGAAAAAAYTHDDGGRLTSSGTGNQSFDYDDADQPIQIVDGSTTRKQEFDDAGQLERIADGSDTTLATVDHDLLGQRTAIDVVSGTDAGYDYDQAGQLTSYTGPDATGSATVTQGYAYDASGLRQYTDLAGDRTHETWDRSGGLALMLQDGADSYIYGPNGMVIEQITPAGEARLYHHDQLGSVRAVTDDDGDVLATRSYTPYGTLKASSGTATTPFGYAGQYTDKTGLQYLRARYYDPATAQFLTRDPLEEVSGSPYGYAGSNPIDYTDPSGLLFGISSEDVDWFNENLNPAYGVMSSTRDLANGCGSVLGNSLNLAVNAASFVPVLGVVGRGVKAAKAADEAPVITKIVKTRREPGRDGGISKHTIEQSDGETISVTHQVARKGEVVHQHQTHVGKYGSHRRFPDDWVEFPRIPR